MAESNGKHQIESDGSASVDRITTVTFRSEMSFALHAKRFP